MNENCGQKIRKIHFESQILALFAEAAKLGKTSEDAYNRGRWLVLKDLLNEWVANGVVSDPHDFTKGQ